MNGTIKEEMKHWQQRQKEIKAEQDRIVKLQRYDLSRLIAQSYFVILVLQPLFYTLKRLGDTEQVVSWKSEGLSNEKLTAPTINDNSLSPSIKWYKNSNFCLIFKLSCLKHKSAGCTPPDIIIFLLFMN